jgi:hypothetical protein
VSGFQKCNLKSFLRLSHGTAFVDACESLQGKIKRFAEKTCYHELIAIE